MKALIIGNRRLSKSAFILKIKVDGFRFIPGQCVNVGLSEGAVNREYSTYSGTDDHFLDILIKEVKGGIVSPLLKKLKKNDEVALDGPYGKFVLEKPKDSHRKYLFVATGTGIAPFHSFIRSYPNINYTLLHGIRFLADQYDKQDYHPSRYIACVSREKGGQFHGRVTDYLRKHPVDSKTIVYLCGNSNMINDVYDILRRQGINGSNIYTEVFF
jgi:ferredoxin--NADP+ reductase